MFIGVDASRSISTIQKTGVEKVSDELLQQLILLSSRAEAKLSEAEVEGSKKQIPPLLTAMEVGRNDNNNDFNFVYYTPQKIDWLPQENPVKSLHSAGTSQKILYWPFKFLWTQIRLGWELIFHAPDVMFFPVHAMPLALFCLSFRPQRTIVNEVEESQNRSLDCALDDKIKVYKVIHDIAFKKQPQLYSLKQKIILNLDLWLAKKLCTKIFVPTWAVKDDVLKYTKINSEKIIVTHWGYHRKNFQFSISNFQCKKKQILYIGRVEEKKNISNLIKAFKIFYQKNSEYKLILAGKVDEGFKISNVKFPMSNQYQNPNEDSSVIFLNYVSEAKKHELLSESSALILVSKEEGFGMPLLEAFDFGLPVVASDIPVLLEVGGEACLYVNPDAPEDIANKLSEIMSDKKIQQNLIIAGQERLKEFDWEKTAQKILNEIIK